MTIKKFSIILFFLIVFMSNLAISIPKGSITHLDMQVVFANENNFKKFLLLSQKNNGKKEINRNEYWEMVFDCDVITENEDTFVTFSIKKELVETIFKSVSIKNQEFYQGLEIIDNFILFKLAPILENETEEKKIKEGRSPYICLVKIPNKLFPTKKIDFISYVKEKNETSDYVFDIQDFLNNEKDNLKFIMDENSLIWVYKKGASNDPLTK